MTGRTVNRSGVENWMGIVWVISRFRFYCERTVQSPDIA